MDGLVAAPFSPFDRLGNWNSEPVPEYAQYLLDNGVGGVFLNGTSAEFPSLTTNERERAVEVWLDALPSGVGVVVHVSHASFPEELRLAKHAADAGAGAVAVTSPAYFRPKTTADLVAHIAKLAEKVDLPLYFYHVPELTGVNLPVIEFLELAGGEGGKGDEIPTLAGVKFTSNDLHDFQLCLNHAGGKFDVVYGFDELLAAALLLGAKAAIGSTYNFAAGLYLEVLMGLEARDLDRTRKAQLTSARMIRLLAGTGSFFSACKAVMRRVVGFDLGDVRTPLRRLPRRSVDALLAGLEEVGALRWIDRRD